MTISEMERKLYEDLGGAPDMFWQPTAGTHTIEFVGEAHISDRWDRRKNVKVPKVEVEVKLLDGPDANKVKVISADSGTTKASFAVQLGMFALLEKEPHLKGRMATVRVIMKAKGRDMEQRQYQILELEGEAKVIKKPTARRTGFDSTL